MDDWSSQRYDAVVVGSGPGGATVARELSRQGRRTLILERGKGDPIVGSIRQTAEFALIPGQSLIFTRQMLSLMRAIAVGGSSLFAYATSFEPPFEMFDSYGVDLRKEVEEAKNELPIAPLSDELIGPAANRIRASAQALGIPWKASENCSPGKLPTELR